MQNGDWEDRVAALWDSLDEHGRDDFHTAMKKLCAELPEGTAEADFELAAAYDSTGYPERAVPLYGKALETGLEGERRRRAVIQLASSLRNLGRPDISVTMLTDERARGHDRLSDAVDAVLALALADTGREREGLSLALTALAPHLPRYQRSMKNYARALLEKPEGTDEG
ncbi:tetratricopeptide repeat protein [Arthrobacter cupressi]|uniref:Tetratrico peptide repeat-containing protein n=1 Tax=Arthrobacter cupressi TaxID=1045773 RepID=A0A1G8NE21_9MICC|nr:tetratricopeptide repeat protein [Arthrobacter cupressi]NYD78283.1 tetratricopeptide (TPR) repeat protein [Arthrobacter cupressi]SDI77760.1 Tetratrico peptide repeat-containing protein [Arthrobacter cupressi]